MGKPYRHDTNIATEKAPVAIYLAAVAQYIVQLWKRPHGSGILYIVYKEKISNTHYIL